MANTYTYILNCQLQAESNSKKSNKQTKQYGICKRIGIGVSCFSRQWSLILSLAPWSFFCLLWLVAPWFGICCCCCSSSCCSLIYDDDDTHANYFNNTLIDGECALSNEWLINWVYILRFFIWSFNFVNWYVWAWKCFQLKMEQTLSFLSRTHTINWDGCAGAQSSSIVFIQTIKNTILFFLEKN